jgi:hypothetical protein
MVAVLAACETPRPPERTAFSPKCPEHLENWMAADSGEHGGEVFQTVRMITASGDLAGMPEVHDCQRLIFADDAGQKTYGPLGVLFASRSLDGLFDRAGGGDAQYPVRAAATINTWEGSYPPLHLPSGWSCLYIVRRPRQFEAHPEVQRVRPADTTSRVRAMTELLTTVARSEVDTAMIRSEMLSLWAGGDQPYPAYVFVAHVVPVDATADGAVECPVGDSERLASFPALAVTATPLASLVGTPGVAALGGFSAARWDADFGNGGRSQHISLRCGDSWCDVMPTDAAGPVPDLRPGDMPSGARAELKGWYDQQYLALPDPEHPGRLHPGPTLATYMPVRDLGSFDLNKFDNWTVVGYLHLSEASPTYKEKLNLDAGWNTVWLRRGELHDGEVAARGCRGTDEEKHKLNPWYAKVETAAGQVTLYCSYQQIHPGPAADLPGIVRWRWLDDDETTWQRCPTGCCPIS